MVCMHSACSGAGHFGDRRYQWARSKSICTNLARGDVLLQVLALKSTSCFSRLQP